MASAFSGLVVHFLGSFSCNGEQERGSRALALEPGPGKMCGQGQGSLSGLCSWRQLGHMPAIPPQHAHPLVIGRRHTGWGALAWGGGGGLAWGGCPAALGQGHGDRRPVSAFGSLHGQGPQPAF